MTDYLYIQLGIDSQFSFAQAHKGHDGVTRTAAWTVNRHKGFNFAKLEDESGASRPLPLTDYGLLIPCDRTVTDAIREFIETQRAMVPAGEMDWNTRGPYYFTMAMTRDPQFEDAREEPRFFGGPHDTAYAGKIYDRPAPQRHPLLAWLFGERAQPAAEGNRLGLPLARYNCWTAGQGIAQYIGGVDMGRIHPEFATAFRVWTANHRFEKLFRDMQHGDFKPYRALPAGETLAIGHRDGGPPFILVNATTTLPDVLATVISGTGETVEDYIDRQTVFTRVPAGAHLHNMQKATAPAP